FGRPGRLDDFEHVWLTFDGVTAVAEASLNGRVLGRFREQDCLFEVEITALLRPRNELVVVVEADTVAGGLWGEVAVEVRRAAYLRKLSARLRAGATGKELEVHGEAAGTSERPLDLYALMGGRTILYSTVQPLPEGRPFHLVSAPLEEVAASP